MKSIVRRAMSHLGMLTGDLAVVTPLATFLVAASLLSGGPGASVVVMIGLLAVGAFAARLAPAQDRRAWLWSGMAAFALHALLTITIFVVLSQIRGSGALFDDDVSYDRVGRAIADMIHGRGDGVSSSDLYLVGPWPVTVGLLYALVGPNLLAAELVNSGLLTISALLIGGTVRRWTAPGAALTAFWLVALFPSLALWSALALKEAMSIALLALVIWCAGGYVTGPRWRYVVIGILAFLLLEETRRYVFLVCALATPVYLLVAMDAGIRRRVLSAFTAAAVLGAITYGTGTGKTQSQSSSFASLPFIRANNAAAARTAFVAPPDTYVQGSEGTVFRIQPSAAAPGQPPACPARPAATIVVPPGTRLVIGGSATPCPSGEPGVVVLQPGETVIVSSRSDATLPPNASPIPLKGDRVTLLRPGETRPSAVEDPLKSNLGHLPVGVAHVLGAPFPWAARSLNDVATIPDVLLWYVLVILAVVGTAGLARRRVWAAAMVALVGLGIGAILALTEGNVGTLFRHRAMLIPLASALAAEPAFALWVQGRASLARLPRPRS